MKTNRKGFTITELVIVIVVIAILAAVLIPTFSSLIKKANLSADQQAVRQMNTALSVEGAAKKNSIFEVYNALSEMGMTAKDYKPLTADTYFFWDAELDRVLHVDANKKVLYPAEHAELSYVGRTWLSLTQKIATKAPANFTETSTSVTINTAEEMAYIVEQAKADNIANGLVIDLGGKTLDMMGASLNMANADKGEITKDFTVTGGTFKNVSVIEAANHSTSEKEGENGQYNAGGLFGKVCSGKTVTIEGVTIENINISNTHVSGAAILVANSEGATINIKDVKIKNCTVIAHRNAGALVGYVGGGTVVNLAGTIELENVHVKTVGGRSGMLIGYCDGTINDNSTIKLTNCTYEMYQCEQNTGTATDPVTNEVKKLGLQSNGAVWSWCLDGDGDFDYNTDKFFDEDALIMVRGTGDIKNVAKNDLFKNVTGW